MCLFACSCPFPHEGAGGVGYHQDSAYPWLHSMLLGPSIILILQWLLVGMQPMNRYITLIYCNHNLFPSIFLYFFKCIPSCFTTRDSLDLVQSFLTDGLMDEGIWAVQDDIVDKRACSVWSSYSSSICLLVVFFLLCNFCCLSLLFSLSSLFILLLPLLLWTVGCGSEGHWFVPFMYRETKLKPLAQYVVDGNIDADITENTKSSYHKKNIEKQQHCVSPCLSKTCVIASGNSWPTRWICLPTSSRYISENFRPLENNSVTVWIALDDADEETGVAAQFWNCYIFKDCSMVVWVVDWLVITTQWYQWYR